MPIIEMGLGSRSSHCQTGASASVIGVGSVANPGPDWHAISTGDVNGDGKSDILLQNDSGEVVVWEMKGASVMRPQDSASAGDPANVVSIGSS